MVTARKRQWNEARTGRLHRPQGFGAVPPQAAPSVGRPVSLFPRRPRRNVLLPHPRAALLVVVLALFVASSAPAVPISDLHKNTASVTPNRQGLWFDVSGVVTSPDSVYSKTNTQVFIQDNSGGISLFQSGGIAAGLHFNLGDSVSVRGQVTQFDGLTELTALTNLSVISTGNFAIDPLVLTCNQVNNTLFVSTP